MVALQVTSAGSLHTTVDNTNNNVTDATSGIATSTTFGSPVVNHNYFYNGTTWDQAQDDASKNLKVGVYTVPSGAVASGAFASGALASGSIASGAIAAGALVSGAGVDGWDLTQGAKADTACANSSATCSIAAIAKGILGATQGPTPAGTNIIGKVGIDQTTPGTTNAVQANGVSGGIAAGAYVSGSVLSGAFASGSLAAGSMVDLLTMRGAVGAGTAPADALIGGAVYNSTPLTVGNTQSAALQSDANGFLKINVAAGTAAVNQTQVNGSTYSVTNPGFTEITDGTNGAAAVKPASTPSPATDKSLSVTINAGSNGLITVGPAAITSSVPTIPSSDYPGNATAAAAPVTATATGTTTATVATIPAVSGKTAFLCGFTITSDATALAVGTAVVAGTISGSLSYLQTVTALASGASTLDKNYGKCVPASAANTAITVTSAAAGAGGNTIVNAQGYYL
jgi:hypothetical protein